MVLELMCAVDTCQKKSSCARANVKPSATQNWTTFEGACTERTGFPYHVDHTDHVEEISTTFMERRARKHEAFMKRKELGICGARMD